MAVDIADILFREILGMSSYPGSPFTGNIFQDIIIFFFVPIVVLIIFVYVLSGLVVSAGYKGMRLLMGIAIFAFIIASRYYEGFAILVSQFYLPFLVLVGILYFASRHFRRGGGGGMRYEGGGAMAHEGGGHGGSEDDGTPDWKRLKELDQEIALLETRLAKAETSPGGSHAAGETTKELLKLANDRRKLEKKLKPWKHWM